MKFNNSESEEPNKCVVNKNILETNDNSNTNIINNNDKTCYFCNSTFVSKYNMKRQV